MIEVNSKLKEVLEETNKKLLKKKRDLKAITKEK